MRDVLQVKGHNTIETETAEEGIKLAMEQLPALILMDIQSPGMDGITALKQLKANATTKNILVIAVTASAMTTSGRTRMAKGLTATRGADQRERLSRRNRKSTCKSAS